MWLVGEASFWGVAGGFFIPTLLGNVAGGIMAWRKGRRSNAVQRGVLIEPAH